MTSTSNKIVEEHVDQIFQEEYFDRDIFSSLKYAQHYDKQLKRNIIKDNCILLAELEDRWLDFYGRLISSGWTCFAEEPRKANYKVTREFYTNALETYFKVDKCILQPS